MPAVSHGMLTASDFHQSRLQMNRLTCRHSDRPARLPNWCSRYSRYVYTWVTAVYLALVLRPTETTVVEVICGCSVVDAVSYDMTTVRRRLLVADLPQLDQLTWRTSRHLTRRLCAYTVFIISVSELSEIAVRIVENEKNNSISAKNHVWIIREVQLSEWIWCMVKLDPLIFPVPTQATVARRQEILAPTSEGDLWKDKLRIHLESFRTT